MSWYPSLFGILEDTVYSNVQSNFQINHEAGTMVSVANGKVFQIGKFSTPTLLELRTKGKNALSYLSKISVELHEIKPFDHIVQGDVLPHHAKYPGVLFFIYVF